jgi:hypothetical protein
MAANEADWLVVLSKELPEGLSSSGREMRKCRPK